MKNAVIACALVALLGGCASTARVDSWRGRSVDDLQFSWGPPARTQRLGDGRSTLAYEHQHMVAGTSYQCTVTFFADAGGRIVDARTDGNIGGCNALLSRKPAAT